MNERSMAAAARVLGRRVGLRLDPAVHGRLRRCVEEAALARRQDVADFVADLDRDPSALQELLDRVTVQETSFFRDPAQFEALATEVLPGLSGPVTAWSAGCANGQEAYSLAMVLAEAGVGRWQVLAGDVSQRALERTRAGKYRPKELAGVSPDRRERFFQRDGDGWRVKAALRDRVVVTRHNLVSDPLPAACQVVFCRNVLIYFRPEEVVAFLERLARWMPAEGHLFLGYSESLWQVTDAFKPVRLGDAFAYRPAKAGAGPAPTSAPTPAPTSQRAHRSTRQPPAQPTAPPPAERPRVTRRRAPSPAMPDTVGLLAEGEAAAAEGDHEAAVVAFRKAAYLEPDHPIAHLHLGLALEAAGHPRAARRAYAAARAAVERGEVATVEAALEGYRLDELVTLLDDKLQGR